MEHSPLLFTMGQKWLPFFLRGRIWTTCSLLGKRGWTTSITRISRGLQRWLSNPSLFSANSSSPHFPAAASVSPWHSATSKEGHGASLLTTCSQTPTIDKHLLWRHPLRATLFALFRDPAALEGDDWESSARVPYLSSFNPLLRVTPPIQHIVCIPSKWACTPLGFTGIGTCLEFCMCSVLLCHN